MQIQDEYVSKYSNRDSKNRTFGHSFAGILRSGEFEGATVMQQPTTRVNVGYL